MELIIINIGLQKGIIGPALFSMLVLMAVVTHHDGHACVPSWSMTQGSCPGELGALERPTAAHTA